MRISDWSSDVCSSDLSRIGRVQRADGDRLLKAVAQRIGDRLARACQRCRSEEAACQRQQARRQHIPPAALTHIAETDKGEQASPRAGAIETADARRLGHAERRLPLERAKHFQPARSEEHTSELQSLMRISYAVFCLKKKRNKQTIHKTKRQLLTHNDNAQRK